MNIEEELQLPFPFGMSGSDLFKLFENVFCVSDSAVILKSAKEYEKGVDSEINSLDLEKKKVQVKIRELKNFSEFVDLSKLKNYKELLEKKNNRLILLQDGRDEIDLAIKLEERNLEVGEIDFKDLFSPYLLALDCKKALARTKKLHSLHKSLQELNYCIVPRLSEYNEYLELSHTVEKLRSLSGIVIKERKFKSLIEDYSLLRILQAVNTLKITILQFEDKLTKLNSLKETKEYLGGIKSRIKKLREQEIMQREKLERAENKLKEYKVCPLCHHELE